MVGWSQPKEDLDRQNFGVRASSSKLVWRFSGPFSAKILARKFSSAFDFFQTNWGKKRKNKKIRAKFGVYNSQVSCPEEAPAGASSARTGSWQSFCARKPPPGALFAARKRCPGAKSAPGGGFLAQKLCQEPLLAEEAPAGASSGQLTWEL